MAGTSPEVSAANRGIGQTRVDMTEDFGGAKPKYGVTQSGNQWILNASDGTGEKFLYIDNAGNYQVMNADQVRTAYVKTASANGTLEKLRYRLFKSGYMSETEYNLKDVTALNVAIVQASRAASVEAVSNFVDTNVPLTTSFTSWLDKRVAAGAGSGQPDSGVNITSRTQTDQDIDEFFTDMLNRKATAQEKTDYFNKVNKEEKAAVKKTKVSGGKQTTTGEYLDDNDYSRIKASILAPAVKGTNIEDIAKGNGSIAQGVTELKAFASQYGIKYDAKQALDAVMSGMTPGSTLTTGKLDAQKKSIIEMSKAFYTKLSPLIDQGVKVSDIASQFAYYKSQMLEVPDSAVSVFDEDIQSALKNEGKDGVMTISDYQKSLRTNPKTKSQWLKTKGAKEEAAGYANEILRSFGLMA